MPIPSWVTGFWRSLRHRSQNDRDLHAELTSYVDLLTDEKVRAGMSAASARRAALVQMGGVQQVMEDVRDVRAGARVETLLRDLRIGARTMVRSPGFTASVVLSLALGVGGTTAIFSVVNGVLLRPLPYASADELYNVRVWWGDFSARLSPADVLGLQQVAGTVADVGAFTFPDDGFTLMTVTGPEVVRGAVLTPTLPGILRVSPMVGPGFTVETEAPQVLIGAALWRARFGASATAIGQSIDLDGDPFTIVGVMPQGFNVPGQRDGSVWVRLPRRASPPTRRGPFYFTTIARLHSGGDGDVAARQLTALMTPLLQEQFGVKDPWRYSLTSVREMLVGDVRPTLLLLSGAVGLVLLITVMNVANLLLARGLDRMRELAVRAALGAERRRLVRQLLAESALFGVIGGTLGLAFVAVALRVITRAAAALLPSTADVRLDWPVVGFAMVVGLGAGLIAGVLPALRLPWEQLIDEMREGGRAIGGGHRHGRARRVLVMAEVALTLTVFTGAALLVKSLLRLESVNPGFRPEGVLSFRLVLPDREYPDSEEARMDAFLVNLDNRLRASPGVLSVAYASGLPPDRLQFQNNYTVQGSIPGSRGAWGIAEWLQASVGYFQTMGIALKQGRIFSPADRAGTPGVAIVNETFARHQFPGREAVGQRLKTGDWNNEAPWLTIVGVVADVPYGRGTWGGPQPTLYVAYAQNLWQSSPFVIVRTSGDPASLVPAARRAVNEVDPRVPLRDVATMHERLHESTAEPRFRGLLFSVLAGIALALAVTGIYGVMAYDVSQRRRETAIRRALGARTGGLVGSVIGSGMQLAGLGLLFGGLGTILLTRGLTAMLFGIKPMDPGAYLAAAATITTAALAACAIPAVRAARADPLPALRED